MKNLTEFCEKAGIKIREQEDFRKTYSLRIIPIKRNQISFESFKGKSILEWCKECGKGAICGRCPNIKNSYNSNQREHIKTFEDGFLLLIKVPSKELAGERAFKENLPARTQRLVNSSLRILKQQSERGKFKEFYLLGAGPCKFAYCYDQSCSLLEEGKCRHPNLANDILECSGVNVFKTVENVGDRVYYIDRNTNPKQVPYGSRVGLILCK